MNTVLFIAYLIVTLWAFGSIVLHGSRPTKSLSWLLTIVALPFGGPVLYYLFGVNRRKFRFFRLRQTEKRKLYDETYKNISTNEEEAKIATENHSKLARLIKSNTYFSPYSGNEITVLDNGLETFDAIFKAVENAKKFIHLQYYIFEQGELTDKFYELFKKKIAEGVEIRLIYDSVGSFAFRGKIMKRFRSIGVKAYPMMPLRFGSLLFTLNYRNHRKLLVIDGTTGFIGGINVTDKYISKENPLGIWKDIHIKVEGPAVDSIHRVFIKDYHFASKEELLINNKYLPKNEIKGESTIQIVTSGPDSKQPAVMQQYVAMINSAKKTISIANPYFIPGTTVLQAIKIAALSGVKINILVPKKSDSLMAKYSMFSRFEELLAIGVNIILRDDFSHSKLLIIDNEIASVGSGNFDYRSFEHNFEANALIYDPKVIKYICTEFDTYCTDNECLDYERFKNRSIVTKFIEGLAKFFSPLL
ncbi:cardiolipin synthase [Cellulophaga baltica]|uniref:cardiolipin synthase n=1 Tax=Cellulophaga TaxID=104264 RepID=UPI001C0712D3|nr:MULTISPECIES: cardiolipin synthase [Cellulophaga]MBU2997709.1 cardiolipin synthase [Cellulophaga baltica]MDO6769104.1 cardiolipin synthase [Cellulophaga sp. 1_MG-2023]